MRQAGQFVGPETGTDALYSALSTSTTAGYGEVHAADQPARVVAVLQLVLIVLVLTAAARIRWQGRAERRGQGRPPAARGSGSP